MVQGASAQASDRAQAASVAGQSRAIFLTTYQHPLNFCPNLPTSCKVPEACGHLLPPVLVKGERDTWWNMPGG